MEINAYDQNALSVSVVMNKEEVRKLRREYQDISWTKTPTVDCLLSEILDYADEED